MHLHVTGKILSGTPASKRNDSPGGYLNVLYFLACFHQHSLPSKKGHCYKFILFSLNREQSHQTILVLFVMIPGVDSTSAMFSRASLNSWLVNSSAFACLAYRTCIFNKLC